MPGRHSKSTPVEKYQTTARGRCQIPKDFHQTLTFQGYGEFHSVPARLENMELTLTRFPFPKAEVLRGQRVWNLFSSKCHIEREGLSVW
jgi:hypothetical protein